MAIHHGMPTRDALVAAKEFGAKVRQGKGDELFIQFPREHESMTIKSSRKDSPRCLTVQLFRAQRWAEEEAREKAEEAKAAQPRATQALDALTHANGNGKPLVLTPAGTGFAPVKVPSAAQAADSVPVHAPAPVAKPLVHAGIAPPTTVWKTKVTAAMEVITPETAKSWLAITEDAVKRGIFKNRNMKRHFIEVLTREIANGRWDAENGETIKLSKEGIVIDGQNRLAAIIASGVEVRAMVVRGVAFEAFKTIDVGTPRRVADALHSAGESNTVQLASGTRALWGLLREGSLESGAVPRFKGRVASGEIVALVEKHRERLKRATNIFSSFAQNNPATLPASVGIVAAFLFGLVDEDKAEGFFATLKSGFGLKGNDPIWRLREYVLRKRMDGHRLDQTTTLAVVIKAWNFTARGKTTTQLMFREDEQFPMVAGLDLAKLD